MSDDDFGFAAPPFNAEHALQQIKRSLRDMKLAERGPGFELRGKRVTELVIEDGRIQARTEIGRASCRERVYACV